MSDHVSCQECGMIIEQSCEAERKPCPQCGSTRRVFSVELTVGIKVYDSISFKHKNPKKTGKGKTIFEGFNGYEFSHSLQKIVAKQRHIDRQGNIYREIVADIETGEVIHQCEEPLSRHTDRGMAKWKPKDQL